MWELVCNACSKHGHSIIWETKYLCYIYINFKKITLSNTFKTSSVSSSFFKFSGPSNLFISNPRKTFSTRLQMIKITTFVSGSIVTLSFLGLPLFGDSVFSSLLHMYMFIKKKLSSIFLSLYTNFSCCETSMLWKVGNRFA